MFDVGFSEMLVIGIVALVVIGPERLPKVARTLGVLFGRMQRYVAQVKADINREMESADLGKVKTEFEEAARSFKSDIEGQAAEAQRGIREAQASIDRELSDVAGAAGSTGAATGTAPSMYGAAPEEPPSPQLELGIEEPRRRPVPARPSPPGRRAHDGRGRGELPLAPDRAAATAGARHGRLRDRRASRRSISAPSSTTCSRCRSSAACPRART